MHACVIARRAIYRTPRDMTASPSCVFPSVARVVATASSASTRRSRTRRAFPLGTKTNARATTTRALERGNDDDRVDDASFSSSTPNDDDETDEAPSTSSSSSVGGLAYSAASATTPTTAEYETALRTAIAEEAYEEAARLRDIIRTIASDSKRACEDANERFYRAFRAADVALMDAAWADAAHAQCVHPGSAVVSGKRDVMRGWEIIFASMPSEGAEITCTDVRAHAGDGWGFVTCVERTRGGGALAATNIFERQPDGEWRMVLHQAHAVMGLR